MSEKKVPQRMCLGCNEMKPKKEMLRIVCNEGKITPDLTGKQSGRGAYLCKNPECLESAKKSRRLERTFQMKVEKEVYEEIEQIIGTDS